MWPDNQKTQEEETFKSPTYKLLVIIQEVKCDTGDFVEYMYFSLKHQLEFSNMSFSFLLTCNITFSTCFSSTKSSLIARSIMTGWRSSCNSNQRVSHCWSWSWDFLALFSWHSHFHLQCSLTVENFWSFFSLKSSPVLPPCEGLCYKLCMIQHGSAAREPKKQTCKLSHVKQDSKALWNMTHLSAERFFYLAWNSRALRPVFLINCQDIWFLILMYDIWTAKIFDHICLLCHSCALLPWLGSGHALTLLLQHKPMKTGIRDACSTANIIDCLLKLSIGFFFIIR